MSNGIKRKGQYGFTLFELLIVMAIAAFAIGTVLTFYNPGQSTADIKSQTFRLAAEMKRARNAALVRQSDVLVSFDLSDRKITFGTRQRALVLGSNIDISITSASIENRSKSNAGIRFFPNGSSTGGTVVLKQGNDTYEIRINWLTGSVSTYKIWDEKDR